ncbi:hypothetical protein [Ekhidna sp.]|uniref:hypothetical protein n=1 Tax=Ekhidna sp. TaxID=2608089 RepID=UPI003B50E14C
MPKDHSIVVYFEGWINSLEPIHRLSEELRELLDSNENASFDGHEIAMDGSHGTLYFYCEDSQVLWEIIKPTLTSASLIKCKKAILRAGKSGEADKETIIDIH